MTRLCTYGCQHAHSQLPSRNELQPLDMDGEVDRVDGCILIKSVGYVMMVWISPIGLWGYAVCILAHMLFTC